MGAGASVQEINQLAPHEKQDIVQCLKKTMEQSNAVNSTGPQAEQKIAEAVVTQVTQKVNEVLLSHTQRVPDKVEAESSTTTATSAGAMLGISLQAVEDLDDLSKQVTEQLSPLRGPFDETGATSPSRTGALSPDKTFRQRRLTFAKQRQASRHISEHPTTHIYSSHEIGEMAPLPAPFPSSQLGTYSCHGIEPSWEEDDGFVEKINQDRGCVVYPFHRSTTEALFCVYDGHGEHGDIVSQYVMTEVPKRLERHMLLDTDPAFALSEVFIAVDRALEDEGRNGQLFFEPMFSGCTAICVYVHDNVMWVANTGDSRGVMCVKQHDKFRAVNLTRDHNPDGPGEQERILAAGGFVSPPPEEGLSARVWLDPAFTQIGLAMSRSIGDHAVKSVGVIADPEVVRHEIVSEDCFMILATDGVWEFIDSQEAVDIVVAHLDEGVEVACQKLIGTAAGRWQDVEGDYRDDITAIIVTMPIFRS